MLSSRIYQLVTTIHMYVSISIIIVCQSNVCIHQKHSEPNTVQVETITTAFILLCLCLNKGLLIMWQYE